jgi:hypothetical protein
MHLEQWVHRDAQVPGNVVLARRREIRRDPTLLFEQSLDAILLKHHHPSFHHGWQLGVGCRLCRGVRKNLLERIRLLEQLRRGERGGRILLSPVVRLQRWMVWRHLLVEHRH